MRKLLLFFALVISNLLINAQNYNNIVNYNFNGTPTHGVKIKTNLPFTHGVQMPYLKIEGNNGSQGKTLSLNLVWHVLGGNFVYHSVSGYGGSTPDVWLSTENNKVVIFIDQKVFYQRFTVSAFAQNVGEYPSHFQNWTVVDEPLGGMSQTKLPYKNNFGGNVGIRTENPQYTLDVNGIIRGKEIKVEVENWSDFVFDKDYNLASLKEVEAHINEYKHLPNIPSEKQVKEEGINIAEMQAKLLQKIEELTLYIIKQEKEIEELKRIIEEK